MYFSFSFVMSKHRATVVERRVFGMPFAVSLRDPRRKHEQKQRPKPAVASQEGSFQPKERRMFHFTMPPGDASGPDHPQVQ